MMPMGGANPADSPANEQSESVAHIVPDPLKMAELRPAGHGRARTVFDPEIPVNITELGLIYDVLVDARGEGRHPDDAHRAGVPRRADPAWARCGTRRRRCLA